MRALAPLLLLAACAEFPALDARLAGEAEAAPPALLPLGPLLARADLLAGAAPPGGLEARAAALAARAAALRGAVLSPEERARLGL